MAGNLAERLAEMGIPRPRCMELFETAMRHRSTGRKMSNERLEFLGDTVLATAVSAYLVDRYTACDEGFLTKMRTKMVRGSTLAEMAVALRLGEVVVLSDGADRSGKRDDAAVMEDTLEALIGALFMDRGFEAAAAWVQRLYETHLDFSDIVQGEVTDKERLMRHARCKGDDLEFETAKLVGGEHKVVVRIRSPTSPVGVVIGVGEGSKKEATDSACERALRHYGVA